MKMKLKYRALALLSVLVLLLTIPGIALAGTQSWTNGDVTVVFTTPNGYGFCPAEPATDNISVTGLPAGWQLVGSVETQYVVPSGRQLIDHYPVSFVSDGSTPFELTVLYPPIDQWPATLDPDTGLRELHVDIAIVAYDDSGALVGWLGGDLVNAPGTLGPGNDWDLWCNYTPPPPPPPGPGTGTPGYWKNHPEAWPVTDITIGGITYTREQAIAIMEMPDGDKTYTVFRALVAAKLNVLIGCESSCIADTIAAADTWMAAHPAGSGVEAKSSAWKVGEPLYTLLDQYNNGLLCAPHRD